MLEIIWGLKVILHQLDVKLVLVHIDSVEVLHARGFMDHIYMALLVVHIVVEIGLGLQLAGQLGILSISVDKHLFVRRLLVALLIWTDLDYCLL